ncbi:16S rRNA processing protein RimM [Sphingomonas parva]|uniref:Ribosome maturation factor RimM n=1 Tax=Sphingomonas parva TaxID=2555898 RepID=A0A4Y8ZTJ3_9SPHN|nr:ribosome maturation factor RimM [Sphingomonas parva]TFI59348.1 16S rRNA processing protein RimM [Sphingomonas parva]
MTEDSQVTLAAIAGAHGISGEVRLKLFAEGIDSLKRQQVVTVGSRPLTIAAIKQGANPILRFAEVADRNAAETLRGQLLTVPRSALPPLEEGEYYHADLIGLSCVDAEGRPLGSVAAVENFGAGDIIEIEKPDGKRAMVPFRDGVADLKDGRIVVDPAFLA